MIRFAIASAKQKVSHKATQHPPTVQQFNK